MVLRRTECVVCKRDSGRLYGFPKNEERQKSWMDILRLEHLLERYSMAYIYQNSRLCSTHFPDSAFTSTLKLRLSKFAQPVDMQQPNQQAALPIVLPVVVTPVLNSPTIRGNRTFHPSQASSSTPIDNDEPSQNSVRTPKTLEIARLRTKVSKLEKKVLFKEQKKEKMLDSLKDKLTLNQYQFVLSLLKNSKKKAKGYRWTPRDKAFALSIHNQSPAAYRILKKHLSLPCKSTLLKSVGRVAEDDGVCPILLRALSAKVKNMKQDHEKICTIAFDEMSIKSHLSYNANLDAVDGFESARIEDGNPPQLATQSLVFMIRGLTKNWKQIISYYFRGSTSRDGWLQDVLLNVIDKVQSCGLTVATIVCDQGPNNQGLFRDLKITQRRPFFFHKKQKIFAIYDMPHLLKSLRKNFKNYRIEFLELKEGNEERRECAALWNDVETLYEYDQARTYQLVPKLKKAHIEAKGLNSMKVSLAAQIFSRSVAVGIETLISLGKLNPSAMETADFIANVDSIFDSMNSTTMNSPKDYKPFAKAVTKDSGHIEQWKKWIDWIRTWKFISATGKSMKLASHRGFVVTLRATIGIWNKYKDTLPYLMTNRLNQDCIENSFSSIRRRGGFRDNPSAQEFRSAVRNVIVHNFSKETKGKNCEDDGDSNLVLLSENSPASLAMVIEDNAEMEDNAESDDELVIDEDREEAPPITDVDENVLAYVSGFISRKIVKAKKSCKDCVEKIAGPKELQDYTVFLYFKDYTENKDEGLIWPTESYYKYMLRLNDCFHQHWNNYFTKRGVRKNLCEVLENVPFFFQHNEHEKQVKKLIVHRFVTMMIHHVIKKKNGDKSQFSVPAKKRKLKHVMNQ